MAEDGLVSFIATCFVACDFECVHGVNIRDSNKVFASLDM
jgi:hypothetical protein